MPPILVLSLPTGMRENKLRGRNLLPWRWRRKHQEWTHSFATYICIDGTCVTMDESAVPNIPQPNANTNANVKIKARRVQGRKTFEYELYNG